MKAHLATLETQLRAVEGLRDSLHTFLGSVPGDGVAPAGDGVSRALVEQMIAEAAPGAVTLVPVEALRKRYLEQTAQRLADDIRALSSESREVLLYLVGQGIYQTITAAAKAIHHSDNGNARTKITDAMLPLLGSGMVSQGGGGKMGRRAELQGWARSGLGPHNPTDDEVQAVEQRALSLLEASDGP